MEKTTTTTAYTDAVANVKPISEMTDAERRKAYRYQLKTAMFNMAGEMAEKVLKFKGVKFRGEQRYLAFEYGIKKSNRFILEGYILIETFYSMPLRIYNGTSQEFEKLTVPEIREIPRAAFSGVLEGATFSESELGGFDTMLGETLTINKLYKIEVVTPNQVVAFYQGKYYLSVKRFYLVLHEA